MAITPARVIAVGVGDDRPLDRAPGVDIELTGRAVETFRASDDQIHAGTFAVGWLTQWVKAQSAAAVRGSLFDYLPSRRTGCRLCRIASGALYNSAGHEMTNGPLHRPPPWQKAARPAPTIGRT
jgi:hypothetical protein